jgi:hypothetical protein
MTLDDHATSRYGRTASDPPDSVQPEEDPRIPSRSRLGSSGWDDEDKVGIQVHFRGQHRKKSSERSG